MSKVGNIAPVSDASLGSLPPQTRNNGSEPPPATQPDVRLVIEEDERTGSFVYKTMDRRTGQVIQQFPREEVLRLQQENEYTVGAIIKAQA